MPKTSEYCPDPCERTYGPRRSKGRSPQQMRGPTQQAHCRRGDATVGCISPRSASPPNCRAQIAGTCGFVAGVAGIHRVPGRFLRVSPAFENPIKTDYFLSHQPCATPPNPRERRCRACSPLALTVRTMGHACRGVIICSFFRHVPPPPTELAKNRRRLSSENHGDSAA